MSLRLRWILVLILNALPYVLLGAAGSLWLYERNLGIPFLIVAAIISAVGWFLIGRFSRPAAEPVKVDVEPDPMWSPRGKAAYAKVETFAATVNINDYPFEQPDRYWSLLRKVLDIVAAEYHPTSVNPALEVPVTHALKIVSLVSRDLSAALTQHVPGAHIVTLNDVQRFRTIAGWYPTIHRLYRLGMALVNPAAAIFREANTYVQGQIVDSSTAETRRWALDYAVKRAGYYAVQLYSGQLVVQDAPFEKYMTDASKSAQDQADRRDQVFDEEPLRILVLGQVKAGKSSAVNAIFGETKAAVDAVPRTKGVVAYRLERDGVERGLILDTAGYEDVSSVAASLSQLKSEVLRCDLILLVSSAVNSARDADRRLLHDLRTMFQADPDREFPPLIVVMTHIDLLRPVQEWAPPYNIAQPTRYKELQIRDALDTTASDLQVEPERVIPVCLKGDRLYNVDDGLIPAIHDSLDSAHRVRYLRCLREYKDEQYWQKLREQASSTGRLLLHLGSGMFGKAGGLIDGIAQKLGKK